LFILGAQMAHRRGESRTQAALFPVMLDDLVAPDALVRVIDAWIGSLNLTTLGFSKTQPQRMGRPPYDPADLLKLYVCGYLNGVRSSRALERECHRNVEVMWLLGRLAPDHKTIAEFRRENSAALVAVSASFVQFARQARLIQGELVAIDGSKIRAVASKKALARKIDLQRTQQAISEEIANYLSRLDNADQDESGETTDRKAVQAALTRLQQRQAEIHDEIERMDGSESTLSVQGESQARAMKSLHGAPGYNLQTAVDAHSHLIVHHEVCNDTSDIKQLAPMAQTTTQVLDAMPTVLADAGYANADHLQLLEQAGQKAFVATLESGNPRGKGQYYRLEAFTYDRERDCYVCPANELLQRRQVLRKEKTVVYAAPAERCRACALKPQCTGAQQRFVSRLLNADAVEANARRVAQQPEMMKLRRRTVEHPFGTIKHEILRNARLLMRGLKGAKGELSLAVLAYNLKRLTNWKGTGWTLAAIRA
jgi:transposase